MRRWLKLVGVSVVCGLAFFGLVVLWNATHPPYRPHPMQVRCIGMDKQPVVVHSPDAVAYADSAFSFTNKLGRTYYFKPSLDMACVTAEEGPDI